jgi:hypothetical protein
MTAIADAPAKLRVGGDIEDRGELDRLEREHARREQRMTRQRAPVPDVCRAKDWVSLRHRTTSMLSREREIAWRVVTPLLVHGPETGATLIMMNDRASSRQPASACNSS